MTDKYVIIPEGQELDEEALETISGGMFRPRPQTKPGGTGAIGGPAPGPRPTTKPAPEKKVRVRHTGKATIRTPQRRINTNPLAKYTRPYV